MSLESVAFVLYYLRSNGKGVANKQAKEVEERINLLIC